MGVVVGVAQGDSAPPINKQAALYSIKLLARRLAAGHREEFVKVGMMEDSLVPRPIIWVRG